MQMPSLPLLGQKLQYSDLIFIPIFALWLWSLAQNKKQVTFDRRDFTILLLAILMLISMVNSKNYLKSCIDYVGVLYLFAVYFFIRQVANDKDIWKRIVIVWVMTSIFILLPGIGSYVFSLLKKQAHPFTQQYAFVSFLGPRICSTFKNPNMMASYLHVSVIFGLVLFGERLKLRQGILLIGVVILFLVLGAVLAKTRLIAGILLSMFLIILLISQENKLLILAKYLIFLALVISCILSFATVIWWVFPIDMKMEESTLNIKLNLNYFPYYSYNKTALAMMINHPILGVGIGMYNSLFMDYVDFDELATSFHTAFPGLKKGEDPYALSIKQNGMDPHSTYLGWGAEIGLPGLAAMIYAFFCYCFMMITRLVRETDDYKRFVIWCFFGGMCGFLLNGFYIDIITMRHFWIFMGMGSAFLSIIYQTNGAKK